EDSKNHADIDASIATEHLCLSATAHGLATCWVCNFEPELLRSGLDIPSELVPLAIIPLGFAADNSKAPEKVRKPLNDIVIRR
ncbi:MAG: nitroreductase family protein, partial [Muribaculaceae bacterium]|nr:nitroreductase family protein [Muribaculaceae bacterium]